MFVIPLKLTRIISFIFILILLVSFSNSRKTSNEAVQSVLKDNTMLKKAEWMLGKWAGIFRDGRYEESWARLNDSTFKGTGRFIKGKDTMSPESIMLEQHGKDLFYIPIVRDQNNGQPVTFKLTSANDNEIIFENPTHDFPQKIRYQRISSDSIVAQISGMARGEMHAELFPMARVK